MKKVLIAIVVLFVVVLGIFFLFFRIANVETTTEVSPETVIPEQTTGTSEMEGIVANETPTPEAKEVTITYSNSGFSPSPVNIKVGDTVKFENKSIHNMWPASAMHPTHVVYSGTSLSEHCPDTANTSFDACKGFAPGTSWSFTFTKAGSWGYHDHLNASNFGKIVVE